MPTHCDFGDPQQAGHLAHGGSFDLMEHDDGAAAGREASEGGLHGGSRYGRVLGVGSFFSAPDHVMDPRADSETAEAVPAEVDQGAHQPGFPGLITVGPGLGTAGGAQEGLLHEVSGLFAI